MYKVYHAILKEFRLLRRDLLGFAVIFLMPLVLVITITLIQHSIEGQQGGISLPILLVNEDNGELSKEVIQNLTEGNNLKIIEDIDGESFSIEEGKALISKGDQKILIVIPEQFSDYIQAKTDYHISLLMEQVMPDWEENVNENGLHQQEKEVSLYFDPAVSSNVRSSLKNAINSMIAKMETKAIYTTFEKELEADFSSIKEVELIRFTEQSLSLDTEEMIPNAVQHNLPAWTLFAIFFIVMPLSINIVKEKNQGTFIRLKSLPVSSFTLTLSKIIVYLIVCMVQFYLMVLVSIYVFPLLGLPMLEVEGKWLALSVVAFFSALAAIGFGVMIGTFAETHEQAAPFGATSVVILAAIGGLWFPVYAMPENMQMIAKISPLNWGLEAFYHVLLREVNFLYLAPFLIMLFLFFIATLSIAYIYEKKINEV